MNPLLPFVQLLLHTARTKKSLDLNRIATALRDSDLGCIRTSLKNMLASVIKKMKREKDVCKKHPEDVVVQWKLEGGYAGNQMESRCSSELRGQLNT